MLASVLTLGMLGAQEAAAQSFEVKNLTSCDIWVRLFIYAGTCPDDNYNSTLEQPVAANSSWWSTLDPGKYVKGSEINSSGFSDPPQISTSCSNWVNPDDFDCGVVSSASQDGNLIRVYEL